MFLWLFLQPLRGGNGVVQQYELSAYILMWLCVFCLTFETVKDGDQLADTVEIAMLGTLATMAGVEQYFKIKYNKTKE